MIALTPTEWLGFGIGVILVLIALFVPMDTRGKGVLGGIGAVLVVAVIVIGGTSNVQPQAIAAPAAQVQVTGLTATTGATVYNATGNILQVAAQVPNNGTFYAGTPANGLVKFHFDLQRTDQGIHAAVYTVDLVNNPSIYNSTGSKSYYLIQQYSANKTNELNIAGFEGGQALVSVPSASSVQVNVSMTLNAYAISSMNLYGTTALEFQVSIGGLVQGTVTVNVVYAKAL